MGLGSVRDTSVGRPAEIGHTHLPLCPGVHQVECPGDSEEGRTLRWGVGVARKGWVLIGELKFKDERRLLSWMEFCGQRL